MRSKFPITYARTARNRIAMGGYSSNPADLYDNLRPAPIHGLRVPSAKSPVSGYAPAPYMITDPAMGRGYRIGDQRVVPAGATGFSIHNHGLVDHYYRWKVKLACSFPTGVPDPATDGMRLRFHIFGKAENDRIEHRVSVSPNDAQVVYVHGRSVEILCDNPTTVPLVAQYNLDEAAPGLSTWEDMEFFTALAVETPLDIPPFCDAFVVLSPGAAAPAPRIRGYLPGGVVGYDEVLAVPRPLAIPRTPNLDYTIAPTGAVPQVHTVHYQCVG